MGTLQRLINQLPLTQTLREISQDVQYMELQVLCFFKLTLWFRIPLYPGIYDVTGQQYTITRECWTLDKIDFVIHPTNLSVHQEVFLLGDI